MKLPTKRWLQKQFTFVNGTLFHAGTGSPVNGEHVTLVNREFAVADLVAQMEPPPPKVKKVKTKPKKRAKKKPPLRRHIQARIRRPRVWVEAPEVDRVESHRPDSKTKAKPLPDPAHLNALFSYNPKTGHIEWRSGAKISSGSPLKRGARLPNAAGYIKIRALGHVWYAHRLAWAIHYGEDLGVMFVDHINRDRSDNRIKNLRLVTHTQNVLNQEPGSRAGVSGIPGVAWNARHKNWTAGAYKDRKRIHLGAHDTKEAAAAAVALYKETGEGVRTWADYLASKSTRAA